MFLGWIACFVQVCIFPSTIILGMNCTESRFPMAPKSNRVSDPLFLVPIEEKFLKIR